MAKDAIDDFISLSEGKQVEMLKALPRENQDRLLSEVKRRKQRGASPAPQQQQRMQQQPQHYISAAPERFSKAWWKERGYDVARRGLDALPTAGGVVGGIVGGGVGVETGPGALLSGAAGATFGGSLGEAAREAGEKFIFHEGPKSAKEAAKKIALQGAFQGVSDLTGRTAGLALKPVARYFSRTAMESAAHGINLLPSEAKGAAPSYAEKFLKGSVITSGKMERFRVMQNAQAKLAAKKVADHISSFNGTAEDLGKAVQQGIDQHTQAFRATQNKLYGEIDSLVAEKPVSVPVTVTEVSPVLDATGKPMQTAKTVMQTQMQGPAMPSMKGLKEFSQQELNKLNAEEAVIDPALLSDSKKTLQHIIEGPDQVTYRGMADARSSMLAMTRRLDEALPGKKAGLAKKLASLADESMMEAAEKSGIPGLPEKIRAANAYTRESHEIFEQKLVKDIVKSKKPEVISRFLLRPSAGLQETRDLVKMTPASIRPAVQKQVVLDAMRQSTNQQTGLFNEQIFVSKMNNIGDERGKILFGKNWENIRKLSSVLSRINGPTGLSDGSGASLQNIAVIRNAIMTFAAPVGLATAHKPLEGMTSLAGEWAVLNSFAAAITNPAKTAKLVKAVQVAARAIPYAGSFGTNEMIGIENDRTKRLKQIRDSYTSPGPESAESSGGYSDFNGVPAPTEAPQNQSEEDPEE